jgi:hypothetical protein
MFKDGRRILLTDEMQIAMVPSEERARALIQGDCVNPELDSDGFPIESVGPAQFVLRRFVAVAGRALGETIVRAVVGEPTQKAEPPAQEKGKAN